MLKRILFFYIDGFKNLSDLGKKLWVIILIKLVVIFVVIRAFLMPTINREVANPKVRQQLFINQIGYTPTLNQKKEE